jgi:hypothetical protein
MIVLSNGKRVRIHASINLDRVIAAVEEGTFGLSDIGICIACGEDRYQTEPDARNYHCEACGKSEVFGAEEILMEVAG